MNNIVEVVGFIDGYTIDIDSTESADSIIIDPNHDVPVLCIHTVQFKLFPDLYEKSIEMSELNLLKLFLHINNYFINYQFGLEYRQLHLGRSFKTSCRAKICTKSSIIRRYFSCWLFIILSYIHHVCIMWIIFTNTIIIIIQNYNSTFINIELFFLFRYNRQSNEVPGKLSLNIRGIPISTGKNYVQKLYSLISFLVVKSKYLPLTIDSMNKMNMIPR